MPDPGQPPRDPQTGEDPRSGAVRPPPRVVGARQPCRRPATRPVGTGVEPTGRVGPPPARRDGGRLHGRRTEEPLPIPSTRLSHVVRAGLATLRTRDFGVTLATVQDGLDLRAFERLAEVLRASDDGRWLLAHRPRVSLETVEALGLSRLPPGTLGRSLYAHLAGNGLLRELVLPPSPFPLSDDAAYAKARWRETHDLRHVVTGLGTSVRDEVVLQAFQLGQFANRFAGLQMIVGPILSPCRPDRLVRDYARAVRAGHAAVPLAPVRWEDWLHRPVSEVRRALGVAPLGVLWP